MNENPYTIFVRNNPKDWFQPLPREQTIYAVNSDEAATKYAETINLVGERQILVQSQKCLVIKLYVIRPAKNFEIEVR